MLFAIALVFGLISSPIPSPGCHSHLPVRSPTIPKHGSDVLPRIRATTNHPIPFSSTRHDLMESLTEEEEKDAGSDLSSALGGPDTVSANRRYDGRYLTSSHEDGPLQELRSFAQLRC